MLREHSLSRRFFLALFFAGLIVSGLVSGSSLLFAQEQSKESVVEIKARPVDAKTLVSGPYKISLWGVDSVSTGNAIFELGARSVLEEKIDQKPIECTIKSRNQNDIVAQCVNSEEQDLSLFMLQQGYVVVNREVVYGSIYENPYIEAEKNSQKQRRGLWSLNNQQESGGGFEGGQRLIIGGVIFIAIVLAALAGITLFIMRGFRNVVEVQNQSMDLASKERLLREKEKFVVASMIDAEVRTNKTKIEAYLLMYDELLKDLKDKTREPKYRKSGDIIQKQPALSRAVFDGNTSKLDLLGQHTASDIIHYYARIKTVPDYVELEPDAPLAEAIGIVEGAVDAARKIDVISDKLLDKFAAMLLVQGN
ncbi:MAG: thermonuclease family protein [Rhodospirillales bacterium]|nr:thermonuclease family protein [Alphaproteobacteria bacterium]MCB1838768.1 thermonuclease family protein [Alphaproteobacteria bacterium]MCB9977290.1 thermonuclease family protein [Rhodospirillales bacterium]